MAHVQILGDMTSRNPRIINYKDYYQGRIARGELENEAPYFAFSLMNTFSNNNYAFIILDCYVMTLLSLLIIVFCLHMHVIVLVCLM